jgi:hypothetical protein
VGNAGSKRCTKCGEEKPLEEFHRRSDVPDGRTSRCKACEKARKAAFYAENRERILARTTAYQLRNRERAAAATARWRERHPEYFEARREHARQATRAWNAANPERKKAADAKWYRENPDRAATHRENRRAGTDYTLDPLREGWRGILRADPCCYCGEPFREHDHIEPKRRVPPDDWNDWSNLTASCRSCNRRKSAKPLLTFLLER